MTPELLKSFENYVGGLEAEASKPFELPEAGLRLDLSSREGDKKRIARHVHQMCTLHTANFRRANFVKLAYLGRFFLTEYIAENPIGITSASRAILELHAFLRHIQIRLSDLANGPTQKWQERGERFFDQMIRARFATCNPSYMRILTFASVPEELYRPYRVAECIATVANARPEFSWLQEHYVFLCDWIHANLSSQTVSTAEGRVGTAIQAEKGGLFTQQPTAIIKHQYHSKHIKEYILKKNLDRAIESFYDANNAIKEIPESPFRSAELPELTGNQFGFEAIKPDK